MSLVNNANLASFQSIPTTLQAMQCFPSMPASNLLGNGCRKIQYLDDGTQCIEWANGVIEKTQKNPFFVLGEKVVCPIMDKVVYPVTDIFRRIFWNPFFVSRGEKFTEQGFPEVDEELAVEALTTPQSDLYVLETPAVLDAMLKRRIQNRELVPGNAAWTEMQKLMMKVPPKILVNIFEENYNHFQQHHDALSGACFHVLLKMVINEKYVLPESWNNLTQGIISCFSTIDFSDTSGRSRHLELLMYPSTRDIFLPLMTPSDWPRKAQMITETFLIMPKEGRMNFISALANSTDATTAEVGSSFRKAFAASNLGELAPHAYRLMDLLPNLSHSMVEEIFGYPFPIFEAKKEGHTLLPQDHLFVRRFSWSPTAPVVSHGDLIIGVKKTYTRKEIIETIIAFDKGTGRIVWGHPLTKPIAHFKTSADLLAVAYEGESSVHLYSLQPLSLGAKFLSIKLPGAFDREKLDSDQLHITSDSFMYFWANVGQESVLFGSGSTICHAMDKLVNPFKIKKPSGQFCPLGRFLAFTHYNARQESGRPGNMVIVDHEGTTHELANIEGAAIKNGQLFTLVAERNYNTTPTRPIEFRLILKRQPIAEKSEAFRVTGTGKEVRLPDLNGFELLGVGDDGIVIGLETKEGSGKKYPCFVNMETGQIVRGKDPIEKNGPQMFDSKRSAIWYWDPITKIVRKHTIDGSQNMGTLDSLYRFRMIDEDGLFVS